MPPRNKEERKRGKKRKKAPAEAQKSQVEDSTAFFVDTEGANGRAEEEQEQEQPAWLVERPVAGSSSQSKIEASTPFGLVDLDLKAYLRTTHIQLEEFMEAALAEGRSIADDDEVKTLRNAMLDEIKGKELTLATDGDTSRIMEDMVHSFSARQARILADALTRSVEDLRKLSCHRFGSHLLQSTLVALQEFSSQEGNDTRKGKKSKDKVFAENGEALRSAQQLVLDISNALSSFAAHMLSDPFATHVLRTVILVLSGRASSAVVDSHRSKKSRAYKEKVQSTAVAKSAKGADDTTGIPSAFGETLLAFLGSLEEELDGEKVRSLCRDPIAGPTIALIIEVSHSVDNNSSHFLLESLLGGIDSLSRLESVEDLMKDSVGSHVLQRLLQSCSNATISSFWDVYIKTRLCKLGIHPTANFVVATVVRQLEDLSEACKEIELAGDSLVKNQKLGIMLALLERAHALSQKQTLVKVAPNEMRKKQEQTKSVWTDKGVQSTASRAVLSAFGFDEETMTGESSDKSEVVKVLLSGKTLKSYRKEMKRLRESSSKSKESKTAEEAVEEEMHTNHAEQNSREDFLVSMQGSLLCQAMLRLRDPGNALLLESLISQPSLLPIASNPQSVHVALSPFQANAECSFTQRKQLSSRILSELSPILSDKFGSRLIDCLFDRNDAFFKEKIMRQCIEEERNILTSNFGRYFLKRTNVSLFRKDVGQWKRWIKERESASKNEALLSGAPEAAQAERPSKKAKTGTEMELDSILSNI